MNRRRVAWAALGAVAVLSLLWAGGVVSLPWTHDLDNQVSIKPQEMPLPEPAGSVPTTGIVHDGDRAHVHGLVNPTAAADTSALRQGANAFHTFCTPCHGLKGLGDGTVAKSLPIPPVNLTDPTIQSTRSDGSIYFTIRHGNVIMPGYRYALTPQQTWDVVNYVRTLKAP